MLIDQKYGNYFLSKGFYWLKIVSKSHSKFKECNVGIIRKSQMYCNKNSYGKPSR